MVDGNSPAELGLTKNDLGIKDSETMKPLEKSITGKDLPAGWPQIASNEEEQRVYESLYDSYEDMSKPPTHQPIDKLSYTLANGDKQLRYLAVQHIFGSENRNHPQFVALKEDFESQKPQIVLYEGSEDTPETITEEDAFMHGEKAYMEYLVLEHNKNLPVGEQEIIMESCDIQPQEEVEEYRKRGYSNEEITASEILRWMYYEVQGIKNTLGLTDEQKSQKIQELQEKYDANPSASVNPDFFSWVSRSDGQQWSTDLVKAEIGRQTGQPLSVNCNYLELPRFKQMFDDAREFRDPYIVRKIAKAGRKYDRVMVVMGSGHAIRQKQALEQFYEAKAA